MTKQKITLYYDTNCNLCRRYIEFVRRRDKDSITDFRSIYEKEKESNSHGITSIILDVAGVPYTHSTAIFKHWTLLGGGLKFLGCLGLAIPRFLRDPLYYFIAKNRYAWFGKCDNELCE